MQRAEKYHKTWGYSLVEAKKNVADLQQIMANRVMGVSIPVLGVVFDINDLSLISGVTFVILLSWFHFALRRQNKNIRHVFYIAEQADLSEREDPVNCLSAAYFLLAMTQVLTIPPSSPAEIGKQTFLRRVSRLPSIIMWTAVIAQFAVVADDFMTMDPGNTLNPTVNYVETGLATALLIYLVIRTSECYRYMTDTQSVWDQALVDAFKSPAERRALARGGRVDFSEP